MKAFKLYWFLKKPMIIHGENIDDAFKKAGFTVYDIQHVVKWEELPETIEIKKENPDENAS